VHQMAVRNYYAVGGWLGGKENLINTTRGKERARHRGFPTEGPPRCCGQERPRIPPSGKRSIGGRGKAGGSGASAFRIKISPGGGKPITAEQVRQGGKGNKKEVLFYRTGGHWYCYTFLPDGGTTRATTTGKRKIEGSRGEGNKKKTTSSSESRLSQTLSLPTATKFRQGEKNSEYFEARGDYQTKKGEPSERDGPPRQSLVPALMKRWN